MRKGFLTTLCCLAGAAAFAQSGYVHEIDSFRQAYKKDFLTDEHSPLKAADTGFLRFYNPDNSFRVMADFIETPGTKPFDIATHSGRKKPYRQYGTVTFKLDGKEYKLAIYQGLDLIKKKELKDYLFIPFNDLTNYETTYAGGRYLDLHTSDIKSGKVVVDFNKAYNPYCAFAEGYSCPIPPDENRLQARIEAGEKMFAKKPD